MIRGAGWGAAFLAAGIAQAEPACTPQQALDEGRTHVRWYKAITERRFDDVDREVSRLLAAVREGRGTDEEAVDAFEGIAGAGADREILHGEWIARMPKSEAARLTRAFALFARAQQLRGSAYMSKTAEAQVRSMENALEEAAAEVQRAEALSPNPVVEAALRVDMLKLVAPHRAVRAAYEKAIADFPRTVAVRRNFIFAAQPQWGGSLEEMEAVIAGASGLPEASRRFLRSYADATHGRYLRNNLQKEQDSIPYFEKSLAACGGMYGVAASLMTIYSKTNKYAGIIPATDAYIARFPGSGYGYRARGWAKGNLGRSEEAFDDYTRAAARGDLHAYFMLGVYYERGWKPVQRDPAKALDYFTISDEKGDAEATPKVAELRKLLGVKAPAGYVPGPVITLCEDRDARMDFERKEKAWDGELRAKKYDDLDRRFNALLDDQAAGKRPDADVDRAFGLFRAGPWAGPLHEEWVRLHPRSSAAHLAYAYYLVHTGYQGRAGGDAPGARRRPSAESAAAFRAAVAELVLAERTLRDKSLAAALRIRIAAADPDAGAGGTAALYSAAIAGRSAALAPRIQYIYASHPREGGDPRQLDAVEADARTLDDRSRRYVSYLVEQQRGAVAEWSGDKAGAIRHYSTSAPLCRGLDFSIDALARLQKDARDWQGLARTAGDMIERDPHNGYAWWLRGVARQAMKKEREALSDLQRAADLGFMAAYIDLGAAYESGTAVARDLRHALEMYEIAESADQAEAGPRIERVHARMAAKRP